ncbi:hypothetical protein Poli38472_011180 [Pythium oligandrum]|uniref:Uncharacterized protein n=1 Tax=Pythium oligandrum TaxID=41045 RepID=A0A8K1FKW2_PYTOL|nr:hypothetical protein Poli38472_011180 [Pythium oligandrum]|eukprot:TMW67560.1 hypothetical protein Poli38472_011180 [Pythium oligandrum]
MLAKVMHNNRRLNYIEAFFKPTYYKVYLRALEAGKAVMAASNRAENNEDVDEEEERREEDDPIIELPLPMSTKCAFLSTFPHHSGDSNTTISQDLDMQATLLIFEFAATPVRRTAVIRQESYDF